jgi:hypothetical protein
MSAPLAASDGRGDSCAICLPRPGEGELLADLLDRWQTAVARFQGGEELLDARHDGASAQVYRDRSGLAGELAAVVFSARLRDEIDLDALSAELLVVVDQTMQPTKASLWLRPPTSTSRDHGDAVAHRSAVRPIGLSRSGRRGL